MKLFKTNNIDVVKAVNFSLTLAYRMIYGQDVIRNNVTYMTCDKIFVHYGN